MRPAVVADPLAAAFAARLLPLPLPMAGILRPAGACVVAGPLAAASAAARLLALPLPMAGIATPAGACFPALPLRLGDEFAA
jgi:hypothetical protein